MNESQPSESSESASLDTPASATPPLLKSYQLAFLLAVASLCLSWMFPSRDLSGFNLLLVPVFYGLSLLHWYDSTAGFVILWLVSLAYYYCLWWVVVGGWRRSSGHFKLAVAACVFVAIGFFFSLKSYREAVDWTSRGLNPDRPGFAPTVVLLAGTFDYGHRGSDTGDYRSGTAQFEIRMRGSDYYYAERWTGDSWKYGSWDALMLCLPGFSGKWNRSFSGSGHHGRGGTGSRDPLLIGQRMWKGQEFIGATAADEYSIDGATERFSKLKQFGRFQIPERIEWTKGERHEVLKVRRVEFLNSPGTNWFSLIEQKYFEHGEARSQLLKTNLNEAGWSAERTRRTPFL